MKDQILQENPNSPENVLGVWLEKMSQHFIDYGHGGDDYDSNCDALLSHILSFADDNGKIVEMFQWLNSEAGNRFLNRKEYQSAGNMVSIKIPNVCEFIWEANLDEAPQTEEDFLATESKLKEWVDTFDSTCRYALHLNKTST